MGLFRVYGALQGVWGPLGCMGPFRVYGALQGVWGPSGCMGPFRLYGALKKKCSHKIEKLQWSNKEHISVYHTDVGGVY
jgi:hypothetical protein